MSLRTLSLLALSLVMSTGWVSAEESAADPDSEKRITVDLDTVWEKVQAEIPIEIRP